MYYLIDFENVGIQGIQGVETLSPSDRIHFFSTSNGSKFDVKTLQRFNGKNVSYHDVPQRKQSVDMHLVSFLGYLIGQGEKQLVIISKDTDYDDIRNFWKDWNVSVKRAETISASLSPKTIVVAKEAQKKAEQKKPKPAAMTAQEKINLNTAVMTTLRKAGYDPDTVGKAASLVAKHRDQNERKKYIHGAFVQEYGQDKGLKLYHAIKAFL